MAKIMLPYQLNLEATRDVVRQIESTIQHNRWPREIIFDFSNLNFCRPSGVVFLSNLIHWLIEKRKITVDFEGINTQKQSIIYLDDSEFFLQHTGNKFNDNSGARNSTIPYTQITHERSHNWLVNELIPWISIKTNYSVRALTDFRICLSELFNNIDDHSSKKIGGIFAQHFPKENIIETAVADFGVGIPANVRKIRNVKDDSDAIILATTQDFTSRSTPRNRGLGLDTLIKYIVIKNEGAVTISSGNGMVNFEKGLDGAVKTSSTPDIGFCPGTVVRLKLRTDRILEGETEEDIEW